MIISKGNEVINGSNIKVLLNLRLICLGHLCFNHSSKSAVISAKFHREVSCSSQYV